jgi:hypothetical protein
VAVPGAFEDVDKMSLPAFTPPAPVLSRPALPAADLPALHTLEFRRFARRARSTAMCLVAAVVSVSIGPAILAVAEHRDLGGVLADIIDMVTR